MGAEVKWERLIGLGLAGCILLWENPVWSQTESGGDEIFVIETQVDYEQAVDPVSLPEQTIKPSVSYEHVDSVPAAQEKPEVKEVQIIQTNRSLKKVIEENQRLREQLEGLNEELRSLRGQRAIELNRINTVIIERDAYKQQTEEVVELRERMAKDITEFQIQQEMRERGLQARIAELQTQLTKSQERIDGMAMERGEGQGLTLGPVLADQKRGRAIMDLVNHMREKNAQLKADEAKVRYNMGNIFFQKGEFQKAAQEYEVAVRLMPQDANAHFNLAFVSGEYLYDHQKAIQHYRQYLFLNPKAEDLLLVKEKILQAELQLRTKVNSELEKDLTLHENRFR